MRISLPTLSVVLACAALQACTCTNNQTGGKRFACTNNADCIEGFVCRGGECRDQTQPQTACLPTDPPKSCTINGSTTCQQVCQPDGGLSPCQPIAGGPFDSNPSNCGECGLSCSATAGILCIASRCTCLTNGDCPSGYLCSQGGICLLDTDSCASVRCPTGEVCRNGICATEPCAAGALPGEVCDLLSGNLRPIDACKLPGRCPDGGICEGDPKPDGAACDDGVACTHTDVCTNGTCAGTTYSCGAPGACQLSVACAGDGGCTAVPQIDGTACNDGNACTLNDSCASGACTGTAYTCTPGACDQTSVCNGDGGCTTTPRAAGASCNDTNDCTFTDVCDGDGGCAGTGYSCPAPTPCQAAVACNGDGGCLFTNKDAGASCDDGLACTTNDVCDSSQVCAGSAATTYLDADRDGRGDSNIPQNVCPTDGGWVIVGGDCNDADPDVYLVQAGLVADLDNDGYTTGTANFQCTGPSQVVNGRTYYRDVNGNYTWLAATDSIGTDCNDNDGDVFTTMTNMGVDADNDGYYVGSAASACVGASSVINTRTYYANTAGNFVYVASANALGGNECNDADTDVYRTVASLGADADHDGYIALTPAVASQCVGDTMVFNTRTYYRNVSGGYTWYPSPGLGNDCNDNDAATFGPFNWYVDGDSDTFGAGSATVACTQPGSTYVTNNSDCNDSTGNVYQNIASLVPDADQDGYSGGAAATQCVGPTSTVSGRTYYRNTGGTYTWLVSGQSLGGDCNDGTALIFTSLASSATDADNDGYYVGSLATNCVGSTQVINGRTYYRNSAGSFVIIGPGALGGADCNDGDLDIFQSIANLGQDADQDGYIATVPAVATQCVGSTTTAGGRTYYRDAAGAFTWLTAPGLGNDCNDSSAAIFGPFPWYPDLDGDGFGAGTSIISCAQPAAGYVNNGSDCNDGSANIYQSIASLVIDADRDGYKLSTSTAGTQCVGNTLLAGGRTYYRDISAAYQWLSSGSSLGNDCDDANAGVLGAPTWYLDNDLDGRGAGAGITQCSAPGSNYVNNGTDCNDSNINVFQNIGSLVTDNDRDGYTTSLTGSTQCVGSSSSSGGRTYYRNASNIYLLNVGSSLGIDCTDADADVFVNVSNLLQDFDNDGYPLNDNPGTICVGNPTTISGRQYYIGTSGTADWLVKNDCINRQGNSCPSLDCYDLNANARLGQLSYFTVNRGDGSFDYDCSGGISANTSGTYCASTTAGTTTYTDGTCVTASGTATICNTPTAYSLPGACGRTLSAGTSAFIFSGVCTTATRASTTVVGCR